MARRYISRALFTAPLILAFASSAAAQPAPPTDPVPNANTRVSLNRSNLVFGTLPGINGIKTGDQSVSVAFSNGASTWSVASDSTWLAVSPASGSGSGSFNITVLPGSYSAGQIFTATLTVTAPGVPNSPVTLPVTLRVLATGRNPVGAVDTPINNTTGVTGAIAVTGWAIDEIGIRTISVWRDPVAGETSAAANGKIFVGNASQVDGARPDVDATFNEPFDYRAGWGYMLLTNMLPNQGNGTITLHLYAEDVDGHTANLGERTIACDNANATRPFGAIDTPDQGGSVSGTTYTNFGWALTPAPSSIPTDGSTILVFIDGVPVGRPVYNQNRADIATLFPGRANSTGAVGFFQFDTTQLANGAHTIAWAVTDAAGRSDGIGSRFFTVMNGITSSALTLDTASSIQAVAGGAPEVRESATFGADTGQPAAALATVAESDVPVYTRTGFDPSASLDLVEPNTNGVAALSTEESGRVALTLGSPVSGDADGYEGYLVAGGRLEALPIGAFLDRRSGDFFWQPGVGFAGTYELVFMRTENGVRERIPVEVTIAPTRERRDK
jgi:BACON domain-containing protein